MREKQITVNAKVIGYCLAAFAVVGGLLFFFSRSSKNNPPSSDQTNQAIPGDGFLGDRGEAVTSANGTILIAESAVSDGNMHAFNYYSDEAGKTIYFFIVKASDGTYRVAANACEVCFGAKKGFKQVGDLIRCENCQVTYTKDKIALEKGGCNPGPINANAPVAAGQISLTTAEIESVAYLF